MGIAITIPAPPRADIGEDCPICGAPVESIVMVGEALGIETEITRPGQSALPDVRIHRCAEGHNVLPRRMPKRGVPALVRRAA